MSVQEYVTELLRIVNFEANMSFTGYNWAILYDVTEDCHYLQLGRIGGGVLLARVLFKKHGELEDFHAMAETLAAQILLRNQT